MNYGGDILNLQFSEEDVADIQRCLNCTLPESKCRGLANCSAKKTRSARLDTMIRLVNEGQTLGEIAQIFGVKNCAANRVLDIGVRYKQITVEERSEIRAKLRENKKRRVSL